MLPKTHVLPKVTKMGPTISQIINCNGIGVLKDQQHIHTKNWLTYPLNLSYIFFLYRRLWRYHDDSFPSHWSAIAMGISQNNTSLAKAKSFWYNGLPYVKSTSYDLYLYLYGWFSNNLQFPGSKAISYQGMFACFLVLLLTLALCCCTKQFISSESSASLVKIFFFFLQNFSCGVSNLH